MATLYDFAEQIRKCTACPLWKGRTLTVPGDGPEKAKLIFISDVPNKEEDRQGRSFVGKSGQFLDQLLKNIGIPREKVFTTNICKCHPLKNRTPIAFELRKCKELWLEKQIELIDPQLIVILGRVAFKTLLNKDQLKKHHGKIIEKGHQKYFITYHPSAALRFPKIKKLIIKDAQKLKKLLASSSNL